MNRSLRDGPSSGVWGLFSATAAMALTGALSAVPWTPATAGKAMLRLSWRAAGVVVEECRAPTEEENARLPAHMRLPEICDGRSLPFLLEATVDGAVVLHDTIATAGVSGDRPLYVLDRLEVTPGAHDVTVTFDALPTGPAPQTSGFPLHLRLATRVAVAPGRTVLITYDPATRSLVTRP
jgi:hypothetical protein